MPNVDVGYFDKLMDVLRMMIPGSLPGYQAGFVNAEQSCPARMTKPSRFRMPLAGPPHSIQPAKV
ncbi:hypothetical protein EDF58_1123 [Novosphingobium sp. PhB57]|jgi:hypothetical protein|nr:hypothetical protein EDF58_1123 [Novosphingobium sp. PhB57]